MTPRRRPNRRPDAPRGPTARAGGGSARAGGGTPAAGRAPARALHLPALLPPSYVDRTKDASINVLFLMPWVGIYLLCWFTVGPEVENQVAASFGRLLAALGRTGRLLVALAAALGLTAFVVARHRAPRRADAPVFTGMMIEGVVYGLLLETVAWALTRALPVGKWTGIGLYHLPRGFAEVRTLGIAVGAGLFEELVFRGILCLGLHHLLRLALGAHRALAATIAVVVSAAVFSAYHHWGAGGEPWEAVRFTFRLHAGIVLGAIFLSRGLGIAALTHAFYDVLVLLDRPYP